jgi:uncharacterized protein YycO
MKKYVAYIVAALILVSFTTNYAQTKTPKVTKKQVNQQKRINEGIKSGELTKKEVVKLQRNQVKFQRKKKMAKADRVVAKKERANLNRLPNRNSKKKLYSKT